MLILHLNDDELFDLHDVIDDLIRDRYDEKSSDILDRIYS